MYLQRWTLCIAIAALGSGCPLDVSLSDQDEADEVDENQWTDESDESDESDETGPTPDDDADDDDPVSCHDDEGYGWEECYALVFEACIGEDGSEGEEDGGTYVTKTYETGEDDPYALCDEIAIESCETIEEPGWCETDPEREPDCFTQVYEECLASGGCDEECVALAEESCVEPPVEPEPDCYTEVFESCLAEGGCEEDCWELADITCSEPPAPCSDSEEDRCSPPEEDEPEVVID